MVTKRPLCEILSKTPKPENLENAYGAYAYAAKNVRQRTRTQLKRTAYVRTVGPTMAERLRPKLLMYLLH